MIIIFFMTKRFLLFEYATYGIFRVDKTIYVISSKNENITNIYIICIPIYSIHTIYNRIFALIKPGRTVG